MKKVCIIFLLSIIISLTAVGFSGRLAKNGKDGGRYALTNMLATENDYLRIHIRADSNDGEAQAVKYYVRDKIVEYLTPIVAECPTKAVAIEKVAEHLEKIAQTAESVLKEKGFPYGATAELTVERFPTRVYDGYTLSAGEYAALIIRLGSGAGDNWWCVVYPPLCFVAPTGQNVVYKSKILEIIQNWSK